mmetsp:Transcript_7777/g.8575  ORF Transcript_7777/g.8575 Transcript_7777/m.8575 type:complete len:102 (-) Transcript_7777:116-421(-)
MLNQYQPRSKSCEVASPYDGTTDDDTTYNIDDDDDDDDDDDSNNDEQYEDCDNTGVREIGVCSQTGVQDYNSNDEYPSDNNSNDVNNSNNNNFKISVSVIL